MFPMKAFLLIALIKTPGEGGTVQLQFDTLDACQTMAEQIETRFVAMDAGHGVAPKVLWTCVATAVE